MKTFKCLFAAMALGATASSYALDPTAPTTINRSMNVVQVTNTTGGPVNDFHIEFIARDLAGNYLDLEDLDPLGYYNNVGGVPLTTINLVTHRITIAWTFGPLAPGASATFGYTLFGGFRFDVVDCYWTLNGVRVQTLPDVWQDWVTVDPPTREIQDIILYRPTGLPPPLVPATLLRTVNDSLYLDAVTIGQVAVMPAPPTPLPILPPDVVVPSTEISYPWAWPYANATYFMFYTVQNAGAQTLMSFRNAALMARNPIRYSTVPYELSSDAFPPTDTGYGSTSEVSFPGDVMIRNVKVGTFSSSTPLPSDAGGAVIQSFTSQVSLELSTDGGATWQSVTAAPSGMARAALETNNDGIRTFDTEMLQLDFSASGLPDGLRIRESPTLPSRGRISATETGERYQIDSFFDIFLEVSTDGGQNWQPGSTAAELDLSSPPTVTLNRSMNVMQVWTGAGVWANDFHVEFEARNWTDTRYLDLDDLDPTGYYDGLFVTNRVVTYNALSNRVSITWYFPDVCVTSNAPAFFGFTLFGGVRYRAVDWYWTYNGQRIIAYQDVWQDWLKNLLTLRLEDIIIPRLNPIPAPPGPFPTPVAALTRMTGSTPAPISIATLVATSIPPNPVVPEPGPVLVTNLVPVVYDWAWPGIDPTYFMYYELLDEMGAPIAGFRNAALLAPQPEAGTLAPVETPTDAFPTPDGQYVSTPGVITTFGTTGWIRNFTVSMVGPGGTLPPEGDAALRTVSAVMAFEGGNGVEPPEQMMFTVRPTLRVETEGTEGGGGSRILATEVVSLDADPDPANPGLRFRESPSRPSLGSSVIQPIPDGRYSIDSFFDIFLEVSVDAGQTWTPADRPVRLVMTLPPPPQIPVTLNRSLNTVRVWTPPGVMANDFHVEFVARRENGLFMNLNDLDPFGYVGTIATNSVVSFDPLANRVSITWFFPDMCVVSNAPAFFGFTVFGGVTYVAVDWYWTRDGVRIWSYEDVWQDWIKFNGSLRDVIVWRQPEIPPPVLPTPVRSVRRVVGLQPQPLTIQQLPALVLPPNPVWPDPGPVVISPTVTNIVAEWAWPGVDPTYFVYYDLLDEAGQPVAGFRNAASLVEAPEFDTERPQFAATTLFPPPTLHYVEKQEADTVTYGAVWTRDFTIRSLSPDLPLPAPGETTLGTFPARVQFDISGDSERTWQTVFAEIQVTARIVSTGLTDPFDMELIAVEAPPLPGGVRIRESPTLPSLGRTRVEPGEGGGYRISSFFDIFTELSIDGGSSWEPASRKTRVMLQNLANETAPSERTFLPKDTGCEGTSPFFAHFQNGVNIHDFTLGFVSHSNALPVAGQTKRVTFMARAGFNLSNSGGGWDYTWATVRAEADLFLLGSQEGADVYSADFKRFDLFGGTMPVGLQVRVRSQSRAESSGFYEVLDYGGGRYRVDSFFDIFLEVSTDSGGSWTGAERPSGLLLSDAKPAPVVLEAWADPRSKQALVMFNRPMGPSAVDPNNYTLAGDNPATMRLLRDGRTVLAGFTNTPPTPAVLTVQDVYDAGREVVSPTTATVCEGLIQRHAVAAASLYVGQPDNPAQEQSLLGSSLLLIEVPYSGLAHDSDGDGYDDALARILDLDLENSGGSSTYALRSDDRSMVFGRVQEQANPVSRHLDMPPFGVGDGLFHIGQFNFIVEIDGVSYTPAIGLPLQGEFLDAYMSGGASIGWSVEPPLVPLLDGEGEESGYSLGRLTLIPDQPPVAIEVDGDGTWHVRWPKPSTNMRLQVATSLELQDWTTIDPGTYVDEGTQWSYEITPEGDSRFYRLLLVEPELFPL